MICFALLFRLSLIFLPVIATAQISDDDLYRALIVGRWLQVSEVYAVSEFTEGMLYEAKIFRTDQQKEQIGYLKGTWRVEHGQLHIRLSEATPPLLPVDVDLAERINLVNGRELVLIDEKGQQYKKLRLN